MEMTGMSGLGYTLIQDKRHKSVNIGLILASFGTFVLTAVFTGLAGSGAGCPGIFFSTPANISEQFMLFITPTGK